jgi:uncharacterized membrane protein (DUF106 family)
VSGFQIGVLIWLLIITILVGLLLRVVSVLTRDVERVEETAQKVKHLFVKSTFEEAGEDEIKDATKRTVKRG